MADNKITPDLPEEDRIIDAGLPSDLDDVKEDVINVRPTFSRSNKPAPLTPPTPQAENPKPQPQPGKTREPDPQQRNKVEPNRLAEARDRLRERVGQGMNDVRQARDLAGKKIDQLQTAKAIVSDPKGAAKQYVGDAVKDEAKKRVGQAASSLAKKGGQALAQAGRAALTAVVEGIQAIGVWLLGLLGPWGVAILAVVVVVGVGAALLWPSGSATNIQTVDLSKPGMADAIDRLAALSGDPQALTKQIKEKTSDLLTSIEHARTDAEKAPLKGDIVAELDRATALLERIRAGSTSLTVQEQTSLINSLIYSLQRVPSLYRGLAIKSGADLAAKATSEVSSAGNWVYSENQQPSDKTKPMRDGTNVVNSKRGCNSSGFVVYLIRGDNTHCAQCITPTLDKLSATFSLLQTVDQKNSEQDVTYQKGDILVMQVPNKSVLEGYVVVNTGKTSSPEDTTVAYCSVSGPVTTDLKKVLDGSQPGRNGDGKRTVTSQVRLISEQRSDATTGTGTSK